MQAPLVFVHIPKTSGTSLIAVLSNIFGENQVRRLGPKHCNAAAISEIMQSPGLQRLHCLIGHFPVSSLGDRRETVRIFTVLRHPVERIMSLYRFLRHRSCAELAALDLRQDFSFEEFLTNQSPELFGQIRNGMCRMLCACTAMSDHESRIFWDSGISAAIVESALETLRSSCFGLMEDIPTTLLLLRNKLRVPFELAEYFENRSDKPGLEWTTQNVMQLMELNTADLVLYHEASRIFTQRKMHLSQAGTSQDDYIGETNIPRLTVEVEIPICEMASRRGFHGYEPAPGFSWLVGDVPAQFVFSAGSGRVQLCLGLYKIAEHYPIDEIAISVNNVRIAHHWLPRDTRRGLLQTEPFSLAEQNFVRIEVPYTVPVRLFEPTSLDERRLSVALSSVKVIGL